VIPPHLGDTVKPARGEIYIAGIDTRNDGGSWVEGLVFVNVRQAAEESPPFLT
jgi:hypothetical protein